MPTWDVVVLEMPAGTGACQKVNNIPLPLEGEYRGMHCISKLNTAMVAESRGLLKKNAPFFLSARWHFRSSMAFWSPLANRLAL